MNWLDIQSHRERREQEVRKIQREAEIEALLAQQKPKGKAKGKNVRRAVGSKLIELGERLQDSTSLREPSASNF